MKRIREFRLERIGLLAVVVGALGARPAAAASDLEENVRISLIGFSPDESAVAYRVYALYEADEEAGDEPPPPCEGYVDHGGKPFVGSMRIVIVDDEGTLAQPIFDWDRSKENNGCTPFETAKRRLVDVKKELAARRIDPKKPAGTEHRASDPKTKAIEWPGCGTLELVDAIRRGEPDEDGEWAALTGNLEVWLKTADGRARQWDAPVSERQSLLMGGWITWRMPLAFVSPSKKAAFAFVEEEHGNMRGSASRFRHTELLHCPAAPKKTTATTTTPAP